MTSGSAAILCNSRFCSASVGVGFSVPANFAKLKTESLVESLKQDNPLFRIEVLRVLKERADAKAAPAVRDIAKNAKEGSAVRAQAILTLSAMNPDVELLIELAGSANVEIKSEALRALTGAKLTAPQEAACEHLRDTPGIVHPTTPPDACPDCVAIGYDDWVHLRMCLACGHVGCCDSSPGKHADAHYQATDHPVMRSIELGEAWRWCFVDGELG